MKELWPIQIVVSGSIVVPESYNFDKTTRTLRREGKIVRNSWHNFSQKEVNSVIASIEAAREEGMKK